MYAPLYGSSDPQGTYHVLAYGQPIPGVGVLGLGWLRLGVEGIPRYPELERMHVLDRQREASQGPTGYFSDREDVYYFSFARNHRLELDLKWQSFIVARVEIPIGVTLKLLRYDLAGLSAQGVGMDVGAVLRVSPADVLQREGASTLAVGLALKDVTRTDIKWDSGQRDTIPHGLCCGLAYIHRLRSRQMMVAVSLEADTRAGRRGRAGLEWQWRQALALRVGHDGRSGTAGLGLGWGPFRVDYALVPHELGLSHRIGAAVRL